MIATLATRTCGFLIAALLCVAPSLAPEVRAQKQPDDPRPLQGLDRAAIPTYPSIEAFRAAFPATRDLRAAATPVGTAALTQHALGALDVRPAASLSAASSGRDKAPNLLGDVRLRRSANGTVRWLHGPLDRVEVPRLRGGASTALHTQAAHGVLQRHATLLGLDDPAAELRPTRTEADDLGYVHTRFEQQYHGIPVWGRDLVLHVDDRGAVYALNGTYEPTPRGVATRPVISGGTAHQRVVDELRAEGRWQPVEGALAVQLGLDAVETNLVIYPDAEGGPRLAYEVSLHPNFLEWFTYFIDAETGAILHRVARHCTAFTPMEAILAGNHAHAAGRPDAPTEAAGPEAARSFEMAQPAAGSFLDATGADLNGVAQTFRVFQSDDGDFVALADLDNLDAGNVALPIPERGGAATFTSNGRDLSNDNPPVLLASNDNSWTNPSMVSAHVNQRVTFRYFKDIHARDAIDGQDQSLVSVISVTSEGRPMDNAFWNGRVMAYGDGDQLFTPLAGALDVAGHEMSHGVIQHTANLVYQFQPGALNESFADVFGIMVDKEDFLLGEDIVRPGSGPALRDFLNPNNPALLQPQPAHMNQYANLRADQDNGGVHVNSGIPNRAAALIIQDIGHEKTERIYYRALSTYLTRNSQFGDARAGILQAATDLHGEGSAEVTAVAQAFDSVGITATTGTGGNEGNDIPAQQGGTSLITFLLADGSIGIVDMTDPANVTGGVFESPAAVARINPEIGDYAQLSTTRAGTEIWFVNTEGQLAFVDTQTGEVSVFDGLAIQDGGDLWNASIAPDGSLVALVSAYASDPTIYIFDGEQIGAIPLEPESTQEGIQVETIQYPDVVSWSPNPQVPRLAFDALNEVTLFGGAESYWSIYEVDFASGSIYNLLPAQPSSVSVGNIVYSNSDPDFVAFNVIDNETETWDVYLGDFGQGQLFGLNLPEEDEIFDAQRPTFAPDDAMLAFASPNDGVLYFFDGESVSGLDMDSFFGSPALNPNWFTIGASAGEGNQAPVAQANASVVSGTLPLTVSFDADGSADPEGGELAFRWEFGDGAIGGGRTAAHTFNQAGTFNVQLIVTDAGGAKGEATVTIEVDSPGSVPVESDGELPRAVTLDQNYPNPFNPETTLRFALPDAAHVTLTVVDLLGRPVQTLLDGPLPAGRHTAHFDAAGLPSGAYLVRLEAGDVMRARQMMLLR